MWGVDANIDADYYKGRRGPPGGARPNLAGGRLSYADGHVSSNTYSLEQFSALPFARANGIAALQSPFFSASGPYYWSYRAQANAVCGFLTNMSVKTVILLLLQYEKHVSAMLRSEMRVAHIYR